MDRDFQLSGRLSEAAWKKALPVHLEAESLTGAACPELSTTVRALWSDKYLYLGYECPFTTLTVFEPAQPERERFGLWERDVVEAFIGTDEKKIGRYTEYELAPNGEKLDVIIDPPRKDFEWSSGFEGAVSRDAATKLWRAEMRIPLSALSTVAPKAGTRWRINLYRCDRASKAFLTWNPPLTSSFHTPERFGILEFAK